MAADSDPSKRMGNAPAFKPLSRRLSKKQVIPDVNGLARGGCTKFAVNCDSVIAADTANVRLPGGLHLLEVRYRDSFGRSDCSEPRNLLWRAAILQPKKPSLGKL